MQMLWCASLKVRHDTERERERALSTTWGKKGGVRKTKRCTTQVMALISLQALVTLVFAQWPTKDIAATPQVKMNNNLISGERDPEAREVPAALLPRWRRQERRGVAADPEQRRSWHQIWQVRQAGLSAQAGREAVQVNIFFILLVHLPSSHLREWFSRHVACCDTSKRNFTIGVSLVLTLYLTRNMSSVQLCLCFLYQPTIPMWNWVEKLSPSWCHLMVSCKRRDVVFVNSHHTVQLSLTHFRFGCESFSRPATLVHCTGDKCLIVISVW